MSDTPTSDDSAPPGELKTTLLEFPCDFPIKIMGKTQPGFAQTILDVVRRHAPRPDRLSEAPRRLARLTAPRPDRPGA
jgi:hypothetical protein